VSLSELGLLNVSGDAQINLRPVVFHCRERVWASARLAGTVFDIDQYGLFIVTFTKFLVNSPNVAVLV
jgi:hypothetical protein